MTVEVTRTGVRVIHLFTPVAILGHENDKARLAAIELRAMTWGDTRRWQRGGFDGPEGVLVALMESVTGLPLAQLELLQFPDDEIFQSELLQHLPRAIRDSLASSEYPIDPEAEPVPGVSAEEDSDREWEEAHGLGDLASSWGARDEGDTRVPGPFARPEDVRNSVGPGPIEVPQDVRRNPLGGPILGVGQEVPILDPGYAADAAGDGEPIFEEPYEPSDQAVTDPDAIAKGLGVDLGE